MGGFANNAPIVTDGLVFYVDAGNSNSYPGSGGTWTDLVGGNDGTLTNGPTFDSGNGGSIVLDGVNDYVDFNSFGVGGDNEDYTFSAWSKQSSGGNIFVKGRDGFGSGWSLRIMRNPNTNQFMASAVAGTGIAASGGTFQLNVWDYITGTWKYNTRTISLYVNGIFVSSASVGSPGSLRGSTAGWSAARITTTAYSGGNTACLSVYNRVLSSSEILQNYNALKNRFV